MVGRGGGLMLLDRATEMLSTLAGCSSPRRVASTAGVCVCVFVFVFVCVCVCVCVCVGGGGERRSKRIGKHTSVIRTGQQPEAY